MDLQEEENRPFDQPGPSRIRKTNVDMQSIANTTVSNSPNATVDQSNSQFNIYQSDSGDTKKNIESLIKKGIEVIKAEYKDIERSKIVCQWNEALNLDLEDDYLLQELSITEKGKEPHASRNTSTAELMKVLNQKKSNRIFLEGDFSTGKTTLCRYLFYRWMCGNDLQSYTLVMWHPLRRMHGKSIMEGMFELFKEMGKVVNVEFKGFEDFIVAKSERILFLLDGLDETGKREQAEVFVMLRKDRFPHLSILATSRPIPEDIPLDCSRYIVLGVSERCVDEFLQHLGSEIEWKVESKISYDILRRPLLLKFVDILARNRDQFISFSTSYHAFERMLLYMIKNLTEKYPERYNLKNKKIAKVAEIFLNPLEEIAFGLLVRNTLMIERNELMKCHQLTDGVIEDQRKLGILAFYTIFTDDGLDEVEVFEFPLKPFAEILAMRHVKKLLIGGDPRVEDLSHVFISPYRCWGPRIHEKLEEGIQMESDELTHYLFALLNGHPDICLKVYKYFFGGIICSNSTKLFSPLHGDFDSLNGLISILGTMTGKSAIECCQYFSTFIAIHLYGSARNVGSSLFENGLMSLIENSFNTVPISFHDLNSLLWTAYLYAERSYPQEFDIRRREISFEFRQLTDECAEVLLDLPRIKDILLRLTKRVRFELLRIRISTRKFTERGMKAIDFLVENLPLSRVVLALDTLDLAELRRLRSLSLEVAKRTKLEFFRAKGFRVLWLDGDGVHSIFFSNFEDPFEFKRCDVCFIGGKYDLDITTPSEEVAVPYNETVEKFEEMTAMMETPCKRKWVQGSDFRIKYSHRDEVLRCTCLGPISRDYAKCKYRCYCGRKGFVNESGTLMVPLKCSSCGAVREEKCCDLDLEITCPHCQRLLQDDDFQSGNLLKMASDLVTFEEKFLMPYSMDEFDRCPSCRSLTRQILKCPGCAQEFDFGGATSNSPIHRKDRTCYILCTHCRNIILPGYSCRNEECINFGVGFASIHGKALPK